LGWRRFAVRPGGFGLVVALLTLALAVSIVLAAALGPADISPATAWRIVLARSTSLPMTADWPASQERIGWDIRLPRAILACLVGASLSVVGATLQAMVRNPLADPTILGGTAGAAVGAVAVIVLGWSFAGAYSLAAAAFAGALVAFAAAFALARAGGRLTPVRLVLAGIAVGYVLSAATSLLIYLAGSANAAQSAMFWLLGALGGARWDLLLLPAIPLLVGTLFLLGRARALDALLFGDETATSLGVPPEPLRRLLFVVVAGLTGVSVALAGGIGFVGLVVPHAVRLLAGSRHRRLLPLSALVGALFLLWADVLARLLIAPQEIPIGVVTALVGAPVFALLLRREASSAS